MSRWAQLAGPRRLKRFPKVARPALRWPTMRNDFTILSARREGPWPTHASCSRKSEPD